MKEFIEKLIDRLEELKEIEKNRADSCDEDGCGDGEQIFDDGRSQGRFEQTHKIIKIVNELAEEYINTSTDTSTDTSTTNADRIRSMTDEELAEFLYDTNHYFENNEYLVRFGSEIVQDEEISILDWLQSEVEGVTENE